jgi:hypothetical protein
MTSCKTCRARSVLSVAAAALAVFFCSVAAASADPLTIGLFSWQTDAFGEFTLGVDVFDTWPANGLELEDVSVAFEQTDGTQGTASFGGYFATSILSIGEGQLLATCGASTITVGAATGSMQVPGYSPAQEMGSDEGSLCLGFQALPQDIVSATLQFTFDALLGLVTVASLGLPPGLDQVDPGQLIFFETASPPPIGVPEPSTFACFATALLVLARRASRSKINRPG